MAIAGTYFFAYHTGELEQAIPLIDHIAPVSPEDVAIGDIVLVHGVIISEHVPTEFGDELTFRPIFKARRELDRWRGYRKRGPWESMAETEWIAPEARLGPWTVSRDTLSYVSGGDRPAEVTSEFHVSSQIVATDVEPDNTEIVYRWHGKKYRLRYTIWPADTPYTVVAKVVDSGTLVPFHLGLAGGHEMAVVTPGTMADAAVSRSSMLFKKSMVLVCLGVSVLLFWWLVSLTFDWHRFGKIAMTVVVLGPLAISIQPPIIYDKRSFLLAAGTPAVCLIWMAIHRVYHWWRHE